MSSTSPFLRHPCTILIIACLWLGGCASKYDQQSTPATFYPQCHAPMENLQQAKKKTQNTVLKTAAVTTAIGALAGLAIGGNHQAVLWGAAIGAASGTALGYIQAQHNEEQDTNRRMANYRRDIDNDIDGLDGMATSAHMAIQCYDRQFQKALSAYKTNKIGRVELDARYLEIITGTQDAERMLGAVISNSKQREGQYQAALDYERNYKQHQFEEANKKTAAQAGKTITPQKTLTSYNPQITDMAKQTQEFGNERQDLIKQKEAASDLRETWVEDISKLPAK